MSYPGALVISSLSTEYVVVPVNAVYDGNPIDPVTNTVQFSFTTGYGIKPTIWNLGVWDPNPIQGIWYNAKCLIGPGPDAIPLEPGTYTVWIMINDDPEVPIKQTGTIVIQ